MILTVLFVAAVGILFGFGRLAMYRDQCVRRFDRQRAIERMLATRSVVRYVQAALDKNRGYETLRTSTNTFLYHGNYGREYHLTLRPTVPMLDDGELMQGWSEVCDEHTSIGIDLGERAFVFDAQCDANSHALIGRVLPSSWLDHPWGLRFTILPGGTGTGTDEGLPNTILCMYLVGGSLPEAGIGKADLQNNPVIRVDSVYKSGTGDSSLADLNAYYGAHGLLSIDEAQPLAAPITKATWKQRYGVQLSGDVATVLEHGAIETWPTFSVGSLPAKSSEAFADKPRIYLGARQIGQPTNATYLVSSIVVRPPYEWDVLISWNDGETRKEEIATVVHAAGDGGRFTPTKAITYDTHGTQWRPGGR